MKKYIQFVHYRFFEKIVNLFIVFLSLLTQIYCIMYVFFCNPHTQDVCDVFKFEFCYCYIKGVS